MKTKIIPFDLETAKKIQDGNIKGNIICHYGDSYKQVRIICWDRSPSYPIVGLVKIGQYYESVFYFDKTGESSDNQKLILEVPDNEPQFKPFDRVLVRNEDTAVWTCAIFSHINSTACFLYAANGFLWKQCIPYDGNEHLVGTTDKPKED